MLLGRLMLRVGGVGLTSGRYVRCGKAPDRFGVCPIAHKATRLSAHGLVLQRQIWYDPNMDPKCLINLAPEHPAVTAPTAVSVRTVAAV